MENKKKAKVDYAAIIREFEMYGRGRSLKQFCDDSSYVYPNVLYQEIERIHVNPKNLVYACQLPKGAWHKVEVYEPSVIFEAKDGAYGEDGSEILRTT